MYHVSLNYNQLGTLTPKNTLTKEEAKILDIAILVIQCQRI